MNTKKKLLLKWLYKNLVQTCKHESFVKPPGDYRDFSGIGCDITHAQDSVRCNGNRLTSLLQIYRDMKEHQRTLNSECKELISYNKRFNKVFEQMKIKMKKFPICPVCKGHQHEKGYAARLCDVSDEKCVVWTNDHRHNTPWRDCYHCSGEGFLEVSI